MDALFWDWTKRAANHKYIAQKYYTNAAYKLFKTLTNDELSSNFTHEHVVPKATMISMLDKIVDERDINEVFVKEFLNKYCISCVVLNAEDAKLCGSLKQNMPTDWDKENIWARYIEAQIYDIKEVSDDEIAKCAERAKQPTKSTLDATNFLDELEIEHIIDGRYIYAEWEGETIKIRPETRLSLGRELLEDDDLYLLFPIDEDEEWCLVNHTKGVKLAHNATHRIKDNKSFIHSKSWDKNGWYSWNSPVSQKLYDAFTNNNLLQRLR